jgi:hypothetical protein
VTRVGFPGVQGAYPWLAVVSMAMWSLLPGALPLLAAEVALVVAYTHRF